MNGNFDDDEAIKNELERNKTGILEGVDSFSRATQRGLYGEKEKTPRGLNGIQDDKVGKKDQADIDAINNRGKNETDINGKKKKGKGEEDDSTGSKSGGGLDKKDGLEDSSSDSKEKGKGKGKGEGAADKAKEGAKDAAKDKAKEEVAEKAVEGAAGKSLLLLKIKIIAIIALVLLIVIFIIFFVAYFIFAFDNITGAVTSFFGVPESTSSDPDAEEKVPDGLYTDKEYQYDENGDPIGWEGLIQKLNEDNKCKIGSGWFEFWDGVEGFFTGNKFNDECQLLRYIRGNIEDYQKEFDVKVDAGLVIATIFYGYDQQAPYLSYDDPQQAEEFISSSEHYQVLIDIIKNGYLKREDVDRIIQSTIFEEAYPYFVWTKSYDEETEVTTYSCAQNNHELYKASIEKWRMFLRWNDEKERGEKFSVPGFMKLKNKKLLDRSEDIGEDADKSFLNLVGSGYVYDTNMNSAWTMTDEPCNGSLTLSELQSIYGTDKVEYDTTSINNAHNFFKDRQITGTVDTSTYMQAVKDLKSPQKETFQNATKTYSYWSGGVKVGSYGIIYDYINGYAYIDFPGFKKAHEDPNVNYYKYDEALTPKQIETLIQEMENRKSELNNVLLLEDVVGFSSSYHAFNMGAIQAMGANCGKYLTAPFEDIKVEITDCDLNPLTTTDLRDYIIGVAYGEIGYQSNNDNYVLSQMTAALSYSLNRRGNYKKGETIKMKTGNCDQVWCSPSQGCYSKTANLSCGSFKCTSYPPGGSSQWKKPMTSEQYAKYAELYNIASDYLLIDSSSQTVKSAGYVNTVQNKWESQAKAGNDFLTILQNHYGSGTEIVKCSEGNVEANDDAICKNYVTNYNAKFNEEVIKVAQSYANKKSSVGDCSSFVKTVLEDVKTNLGLSYDVSGNSTTLLQNSGVNKCVNANDLRPGDLIFYATNDSRWQDIGHVSIFAGYDENNNILIYETNTKESCKTAKGSKCADRGGSDDKYYDIPVLVPDTNTNTIAAYVRWYN